ncbi:DNA double-strand break repair nuclease NurA [Candidatus Chlorohelix sp.]|uniref:DNA double-strand break repair nuclease NurA n=1 Tax=Candidatus Chlorohelix sp. TaxID=3139201 RepID=UPI0030483E16
MPLNPQELNEQIEKQAGRFKEESQRLEKNIAEAVEYYRAADEYRLNVIAKEHSRRDETLAYPISGLDEVIAVSPSTAGYCVVATDSSPIPPDRHNGTAHFYVINIGRVMLRYGEKPTANLDSLTFFETEDSTNEEREYTKASLLDTEAALKELEAAYELAIKHQADLVFRDGPLTLWRSINLRSKEGTELRNRYYSLLDQFDKAQIPIVGYISNTHSNAVVETLRAAMREDGKSGRAFSGVQDRMLFQNSLKPDTRGPIFASTLGEPKELREFIDRIYFTYMLTKYEMVRIEFPQWLALDTEKLASTLSLVLRQIELGQGYPVALMEAHEQAVLRGDDRELLRLLLENQGLLLNESEKGRSKRLRGV